MLAHEEADKHTLKKSSLWGLIIHYNVINSSAIFVVFVIELLYFFSASVYRHFEFDPYSVLLKMHLADTICLHIKLVLVCTHKKGITSPKQMRLNI